jgi:hypothetical protein
MSAFGRARRGGIRVIAGQKSSASAVAEPLWREQPARVRPRRLAQVHGSAAERLRSIQLVRAGSASKQVTTADPVQAARAIWNYLLEQGLAEGSPKIDISSRTASAANQGPESA